MSPEAFVAEAVSDLVTVVEACGALIIAVGAVLAFLRLIYIAGRSHNSAAFVPVRLTLGRYLALGLEFQLAADVLRTAVAPTFKDIGQLAAIATIRTALNYFLSREIAEERRQVGIDPPLGTVDTRAGPAGGGAGNVDSAGGPSAQPAGAGDRAADGEAGGAAEGRAGGAAEGGGQAGAQGQPDAGQQATAGQSTGEHAGGKQASAKQAARAQAGRHTLRQFDISRFLPPGRSRS